MITRENIRELAEFTSPESCAISFYFQPTTPQNKSHREEVIRLKGVVQQAAREAGKQHKSVMQADLDRILSLAEHLQGNHARARAVFACGARNFWREYDLPPRLAGTKMHVNRRFHLRPMTAIADVLPRVAIAVLDRSKARIFELWMDELREREKLATELPRRGRSDGFEGYNAGRTERRVENEAAHHFKRVGDRLLEMREAGACERLIIGCRDEVWPDVEAQLHPYLKQRFVGRLTMDPAAATGEKIREQGERLMEEFRTQRRQNLIREVTGEAHRNGRGALGLRRVLHALEKGEVQTLLLGRLFSARASECGSCGHLDSHMSKSCAVCAQETRELEDVSDAILGQAVRNRIEIVHIGNDPEFDRIGNIAALLRFRADQNTPMKMAV